MEDKFFEEDILLFDEGIFGDSEEHSYDVTCYDGYAVATANEDGIPKELKLTYPTLSVVLRDEDMAKEVLEYRGLWYLKPSDITYGDIMMCFGEIER